MKNQTQAQCRANFDGASNSRIELSAELFDPVHVHQDTIVGQCPISMRSQESVETTGSGKLSCRCCEVAVASVVLACVGAGALAERRAWASAASSRLSALENQVQPRTSPPLLPAQPAEFTARELSLRAQLAERERVSEQQEAAHATELTSLRRDLKQLEQLMVAEEIKRANESSRARDLAAPELDALRKKLEQEQSRTIAMRNQLMELEAGVRHSNRALEAARAQLERERCGHLRHVRATEAQSARQQLLIKNRSEEIASLVEGGVVGDATTEALTQIIVELRKELEVAKQAEERQCCICFSQSPNAIFLPCKHGGTCLACAKKLTRCPLCRTSIAESMEIFS